MTMMSKLCDAADWFRPEVLEIIKNELREVPRFHRKQWESAMILLALRVHGKLHDDNVGLSMGGGKELVLYAVAQHIRQLLVTDLYDPQTTWDCARTEDPDTYVKQDKPFPVSDERLTAMRMDMRQLLFPDRSFDFCYSSCAVEHIGTRGDFLRHFNEVARVLKDDGVYVFTTELAYGKDTIQDYHNYVFSLPLLEEIISESGLEAEMEFDARVTPHTINYPAPSGLRNLSHFIPEHFTVRFLQEAPHIQLLRGRYPFTCGIFVLRKKIGQARPRETRFIGLDASREFMEKGLNVYRSLMDNSGVSINPFSLLPAERSRFFADHAEFFTRTPEQDADAETVFHTDYFWWGSGSRIFDVTLRVAVEVGHPDTDVEVRVHRFKTLVSSEVECAFVSREKVASAGRLLQTIELVMDDEYCYAVLAKIRRGTCVFDHIEVKSYPARLAGCMTRRRVCSVPAAGVPRSDTL